MNVETDHVAFLRRIARGMDKQRELWMNSPDDFNEEPLLFDWKEASNMARIADALDLARAALAECERDRDKARALAAKRNDESTEALRAYGVAMEDLGLIRQQRDIAREALTYATWALVSIAEPGCLQREPDLASFTCEEKYPNADDLWCLPCFAGSELARVRGLAGRAGQGEG